MHNKPMPGGVSIACMSNVAGYNTRATLLCISELAFVSGEAPRYARQTVQLVDEGFLSAGTP